LAWRAGIETKDDSRLVVVDEIAKSGSVDDGQLETDAILLDVCE
jgi:hypothetical protein